MMTWQTVQMFFIQAVISIVLNGVLAIFLWNRSRRASLPTDFEVFKTLVHQQIEEGKQATKELALNQLQINRDLIGVRETVQWLRGKINGVGWKTGS